MTRDIDPYEQYDKRISRTPSDLDDDRELPWDYDQPPVSDDFQDVDPRGLDLLYVDGAGRPTRKMLYCPRCKTAERFVPAGTFPAHVRTCRGNLGGVGA